MSTVTGKFLTRTDAEKAVQSLIQRGYPAHLITVASLNHTADADTPIIPAKQSLRLLWQSNAVLGGVLGTLFLGGMASFYLSLGYLHWLLSLAVTGIGAYMGMALGQMFPPIGRFHANAKSSCRSAANAAPAVVTVNTSAYHSSILGNDLKQAGAIQVDNHYSL